MVLWHAVTLLREFRGDGHVAALVGAELDGCEALVTHAASGAIGVDVLRRSREWPQEEWDAASRRLRERGLLAADGTFTDEGHRVRAWVEERTDGLAQRPRVLTRQLLLHQALVKCCHLCSRIQQPSSIPAELLRQNSVSSPTRVRFAAPQVTGAENNAQTSTSPVPTANGPTSGRATPSQMIITVIGRSPHHRAHLFFFPRPAAVRAINPR
jgi:hypothetical protein